MRDERNMMRTMCSVFLGIVLATGACEVERTKRQRSTAASRQEPAGADATTRARYQTAGDPCATAADCPALPGVSCLAWPSGYCTAPCLPDGACEEGICAEAPRLGLTCLRECASDRECRPGYVCAWTIDGQVCAPPE
jgi:hypothetical protein